VSHLAPNELATLGLLRGLSAEEIARIAADLHARTFAAGSQVMTAEQRGEALYLVLAGSVKVSLHEDDGTEVILALLGPGDSIGEMSLVDDSGHSADVSTLEESRLLWMDRAAFQRCLHEVPGFATNLLRELSTRLRAANMQVRALATLDVAGRVARQLLLFAERYGEPGTPSELRIPMPLTQRDIAQLVGATRERTNWAMQALRRSGAISTDSRHRVTVHGRDTLAGWVRSRGL
jgi:CRP/FNR family transcriptional regulator, cyclic AMP receptor protein